MGDAVVRQSCAVLLEEYRQRSSTHKGDKGRKGYKLQFTGVGGADVYNITAPFLDEGEFVIAGRVEARHTEYSQVRFFVERDGSWSPRPGSPVFDLQDPFVTFIGDELVFGGVEVFPHPTILNALGWRTRFYRGATIAALETFAVGPDGMKDIRLIAMENGKIGVFTRPQGEKGGRGTIGFTTVNSLEQLSIAVINDAPLLDQFMPEEWGGANEIHLLEDGLLGVLGHIACFDAGGNRHYYPMVFGLNPDTLETTPMKLIATRADFPEGESKRPDLKDVVFSGGLQRLPKGKARFFAGISDVEAHVLEIDDPWGQTPNFSQFAQTSAD